jgi:hypothetical protein
MIAIQTKYLPATNTRGSRIKAFTCTGRSVTIPLPQDLSRELVHFEAVKELIDRFELNWDYTNMRYGATENGYVFCFDGSIVGK